MRNQNKITQKGKTNKKEDDLDRFLRILWKKEVEYKLTTK